MVSGQADKVQEVPSEGHSILGTNGILFIRAVFSEKNVHFISISVINLDRVLSRDDDKKMAKGKVNNKGLNCILMEKDKKYYIKEKMFLTLSNKGSVKSGMIT